MKRRSSIRRAALAALAGVLMLTGAALTAQARSAVVAKKQGSGYHGEFSMGFLAGGRSYAGETFTHKSGGASTGNLSDLKEPFVRSPFRNTLAFGLRYDLRLIVSHVRMTVGVDLPFTDFAGQDTTHRLEVGGELRDVSVQSIRPYELRFGIGGEYAFRRVTPYVDLIGAVHWVDAELGIDGETARFRATNFNFAARAGLRLDVKRWFFITASGEVGFVGDVVWNAELAVGFRLGAYG